MEAFKVRIHGTYPMDDHDGKYNPGWKMLGKELTVQEAAKATGVDIQEDGYLWTNKGFIVLGLKERNDDDGITGIQAAVAETAGILPCSPNIEVGDKAVYLHDGKYYLIERVLPIGATLGSTED